MNRNEISGDVCGNVVQAGSVGQIVYSCERFEFPKPAQLPPLPRYFANRESELATLDSWLEDQPSHLLLTVLSGTGGVGKTILAVRWLHQMRDRFQDGQLYFDLGAFSPAGPVEPAEVLEWFLVSLGLPPQRIPDDLPRRTALYRSLTAGRRIALLLDNAFSAAQVRPLLPAAAHCVVVVTSRHRLTGLRVSGARFVDVDPLGVHESVALLENVAGGGRTAAESAEAEELVRLCGGLPIAVSVIGARLFARPHRTLRTEVSELRTKDQLTALDASEDMSVTGIFDVSYHALPPDEARLYRLCALHPGTVFGLGVASAMIDRPLAETENAIYELVERNLLTEIADHRFRYHDLLRVHARRLASRVDDDANRSAAARRMVEWYLDGTAEADRLMRPTRRRVGPRFQEPPKSLFTDRDDALRWLLTERANLTSAVRTAEDLAWDDLVWEFCEALWGFVPYAPGDWTALYRSAVSAARRCDHAAAEVQLRILLGSTLTAQRRYDEAIEANTLALRQAEETGNRFSTATALVELASALRGKGRLSEALGHLRQARQIREDIDTVRAVTQCRRQIGSVLTELGQYEDAITELRQAPEAVPATDIEHPLILTVLGTAYLLSGRLEEARPVLSQAVEIATDLRSDLRRAYAMTALGELELAVSNEPRARSHFTAARDLYAALGSPMAADLVNRLARLAKDQSPGSPS
jgi:tetratricopeptide (TPR) repeat protein